MKDKELNLEVTHTLGERGKVVSKGEGSGEGEQTTLLSDALGDTLQPNGRAEADRDCGINKWSACVSE